MDNYFPRAQTLSELRQEFSSVTPAGRPTPLFWWSGADLSRPRLEWQLDLLQAEGVGGTIVGYSHLPNGQLDHGTPTPLSGEWWELFRWFVDASADRGMIVGLQDYGIIGPMIVRAAAHTTGFHAGTLSHHIIESADSTESVVPECSAIVSVVALPDGRTSIVTRAPGMIGLARTDFDPLHPNAGASVIEQFYEQIERELPGRLGKSFRVVFQDELDLGLTMPMWNDDVAARLNNLGFELDRIHSLWIDGPGALEFRAAYRDLVVQLLEDHYFRPIFDWHEARGLLLVMDQLSRGDLRLGHQHYGDFMGVMKWYHGPGNDDPDLRASRNIAAAVVSASIAHLHDRPLVVNEAFHSSGWEVTPEDILKGANIGFAAGSNHVIMHGLNYTTESGWWEWASPDFHFRQPWWNGSRTLWRYLARMGNVLRAGVDVRHVAVVDPTEELDLAGESVDSPELARNMLEQLTIHGVGCDLLPQSLLRSASVEHGELVVRGRRYGALVLPGIRTLRPQTVALLDDAKQSGVVVVPSGTSPESAVAQLRQHGSAVGRQDESGLASVHRRLDDAEVFVLINVTNREIRTTTALAGSGSAEEWDALSGDFRAIDARREGDRAEVAIALGPGEATVIVFAAGCGPATVLPVTSTRPLTGEWRFEVQPVLDNRFLDFSDDSRPMGVDSWRVDSRTEDGEWVEGLVDHGPRFSVLGPLPAVYAAEVDSRIATGTLNPQGSLIIRGNTYAWRDYSMSMSTGIARDPYLLDRMAGPHGLKGVPDEFLDPRVLDDCPPAGSVYYFSARVRSQQEYEVVRASSRAAFEVWVNENSVVAQRERAAEWFPPWGLRDMSTKTYSEVARTAGTWAVVTIRLTVSPDQPTRAAVVVGGRSSGPRVASRLAWWCGPDPALPFEMLADPRPVELRMLVPRGGIGLELDTSGTVVSASRRGRTLAVDHDPGESTRWRIDLGPVVPLGEDIRDDSVVVRVEPGYPLTSASGVLLGPARWRVESFLDVPRLWDEWGLSEFSGSVSCGLEFQVDQIPKRALLGLPDLAGTAGVELNGFPLRSLMGSFDRVDVAELLRSGTNRLRLVVSNTLGSRLAHLPSPYSGPVRYPGGFTHATLTCDSEWP
ncbi:hypothetical protein IWX81_001737 [Salinibacterium sp. CAN_S4]|uniref:glycosyl hydrolase n=1 Tax=Salinibacterium sp. CAN_S4 TaxID=2787727 RepID=UPI0018EFC87F